MFKYTVIDREPEMAELESLKTLINNDCKIFIGSGFAEELEETFNELDDTLYEAEESFKEQIRQLTERVEELEKEVEELNDRL